jgi:hypothetical protein
VEYDGEWRDDLRNGRGKFYQAGAYKYIGNWKDDVRCGRGKCEFASGALYDGEWFDDEFHGTGAYEDKMISYMGNFVHGERQGRGVCKFLSGGGEYDGEFEKNFEHGKGKRLYADGTMYQGDWHNGVRSGKGACAYANGDQYHGEWRSDQRHGYGVCIFADGTKYRGEWEHDCWCQSTADPVFTKVFGPGTVKAIAGEATMLGIEARDELKNKRLSGGDIFTVKLTHVDTMDTPDAVVEYGTVTDNGDGTYVAHYTCAVAGVYACEVLIGADEHCGHSPYEVIVEPSRASARHCVVSGQGLKQARQGERTEFTIELRDAFENLATTTHAAETLPLRVSATDIHGQEMRTLDGVKIEDDEHNQGVLVVSYVPQTSGYYRMVISCHDALLGASPYALRVLDLDEPLGADAHDARDAPISIAPPPKDLAREWEEIAKSDYTLCDGDDFGWDSPSDEEEETPEERSARENPGVPVVTNYEDLYKVGRLQKRMQEKRAEEQAKKLEDMKARLELLAVVKEQSNESKTSSLSALD